MIMKERETPTIIYSTLKVYGTVTSETLVNHFLCLGLCSSYDCLLEITKGLLDTQIKCYLNTKEKSFYRISQR